MATEFVRDGDENLQKLFHVYIALYQGAGGCLYQELAYINHFTPFTQRSKPKMRLPVTMKHFQLPQPACPNIIVLDHDAKVCAAAFSEGQECK